ncbi:MAG: hypothetical protein JWR76_2697 [Mucilaginibacter sp.]|nr:hypothetical protein [Mucilaginibacter sp.]
MDKSTQTTNGLTSEKFYHGTKANLKHETLLNPALIPTMGKEIRLSLSI